MDRTVSAADANRGFSRILREVRGGQSFIVTAHGAPVARIVPINEPDVARVAARKKLLEWLSTREAIDVGSWKREELYDD